MRKRERIQEQLINQSYLIDEAMMLNRLAKATRAANEHFWRDLKTNRRLRGRNRGEMYMLMVSELAEAFEALRKSKVEVQMDKHVTQYPAEVVELADLYIRMMDYVGNYYPDTFGQAVTAKRAYNRTRKDHTREARMAPGGKAF